VSETDPLLDRRAIEEAFRRLGDRLARRGIVADVYVFGGAAMALAYDARRATRDVAARRLPPLPGPEAVPATAPAGWVFPYA
jgi:hypothetical protein